LIAVAVRDDNVGSSIVVHVANGQRPSIRHRGEVHSRLEHAVAVAHKNRDVAAILVGYRQVEQAIAVEIRDADINRGCSDSVVDRWLRESIAVAQQNRHAVADLARRNHVGLAISIEIADSHKHGVTEGVEIVASRCE